MKTEEEIKQHIELKLIEISELAGKSGNDLQISLHKEFLMALRWVYGSNYIAEFKN